MKKVTLLVVGFAIQSISYAQNITTVAGTGSPGFSGDSGPATAAKLAMPQKAVADGAGNVYIGDYGNHRIRKVNTSGMITTICGDGTCDTAGSGGPATAAKACAPTGMAMDAAGNLYVVDNSEFIVRKINPAGIITRFAGNGDNAYNGDSGLATAAAIGSPISVAVDGAGNVYICDNQHSVIRKVNTAGVISTVAGNGIFTSAPDGAIANVSSLNGAMSVAADGIGNLYIVESGLPTPKVRKVSMSGILSTIDSGLNFLDVAVDAGDNVYYSSNDNRIRMAHGGSRTIIAGVGTIGYTGDGGPATLATFNIPQGLSVSASGDLYVADKYNNAVRKFASGMAGVAMQVPATIEVFPNPTAGKFSIILPYNGTKHVTVTDAVGMIVLQQVCLPNELIADVSGASGNYFITVVTDGGVYHSQLLVTHQ